MNCISFHKTLFPCRIRQQQNNTRMYIVVVVEVNIAVIMFTSAPDDKYYSTVFCGGLNFSSFHMCFIFCYISQYNL
jgi:hypothetical protein